MHLIALILNVWIISISDAIICHGQIPTLSVLEGGFCWLGSCQFEPSNIVCKWNPLISFLHLRFVVYIVHVIGLCMSGENKVLHTL